MNDDTVQTMLSDVMQVRLDSCAIKTHTSSGNVSLGMPNRSQVPKFKPTAGGSECVKLNLSASLKSSSRWSWSWFWSSSRLKSGFEEEHGVLQPQRSEGMLIKRAG
jgi:hypothetical protein